MRQDTKRWAGVMTGIMGVASVAHAIVVEHNPPVPFVWTPQTVLPAPPFFIPPNAFDVSQPPVQSGAITPTSIYQTFSSALASDQPIDLVWTSGGSVSFAVTPVANFGSWHRPLAQSSPSSYSAPRQYANGNTVDGSATYASSVTVAWTSGFQAFRRDYDYVVFPPVTFVTASNPDDFIVGLKLSVSGEDHFGWMAVHWTSAGRGRYDITRWAYETTANTPISVPAPGIGALASACILPLLRRRRY